MMSVLPGVSEGERGHLIIRLSTEGVCAPQYKRCLRCVRCRRVIDLRWCLEMVFRCSGVQVLVGMVGFRAEMGRLDARIVRGVGGGEFGARRWGGMTEWDG